MPPRDRNPHLVLLDPFRIQPQSAAVRLRELLVDELTDALVIFDLLKSDLEGDEAGALLWIRPRIERVFEEIGNMVEELGE